MQMRPWISSRVSSCKRPRLRSLKILRIKREGRAGDRESTRWQITEWPYDNVNRGTLPPDRHSLTFNEYTIRHPPYGPGFEKSRHLHSYVGSTDYVKNIVVDERDNPFTGTNYAWVRARCLGGKTNIWGRLALRLSDYDFKAKDRDGYGENWPII